MAITRVVVGSRKLLERLEKYWSRAKKKKTFADDAPNMALVPLAMDESQNSTEIRRRRDI